MQKDTNATAEFLKGMRSNIEVGVKASNETSKVFEEMAETSHLTLSFSEEMLEGAKTQVENINEVVYNTEEIVVIAEESAAGTEEIASSTEVLSSGMENYILKSKNLKEIASELKKNVEEIVLTDQNNITAVDQA